MQKGRLSAFAQTAFKYEIETQILARSGGSSSGGTGSSGSAGCLLDASKAAIGAASLGHQTTAHKALELLVRTKAEHFFATAHSILELQVFINQPEQLVELMCLAFGENIHQFISDMIRNATRKTSFTCGSHRP